MGDKICCYRISVLHEYLAPSASEGEGSLLDTTRMLNLRRPNPPSFPFFPMHPLCASMSSPLCTSLENYACSEALNGRTRTTLVPNQCYTARLPCFKVKMHEYAHIMGPRHQALSWHYRSIWQFHFTAMRAFSTALSVQTVGKKQ